MCGHSKEYQQLLIEKRKLEIDLRVMCTNGFSLEKILLIMKYRDTYTCEDDAIDDLVRFACNNEN